MQTGCSRAVAVTAQKPQPSALSPTPADPSRVMGACGQHCREWRDGHSTGMDGHSAAWAQHRDGYTAEVDGQHRDGCSAGLEAVQGWRQCRDGTAQDGHSIGQAQHRDGHSAGMDTVQHGQSAGMGIAQGGMSTVRDRQRAGMDGLQHRDGTVQDYHSKGMDGHSTGMAKVQGWAQHRNGWWRDTAQDRHKARMGTA